MIALLAAWIVGTAPAFAHSERALERAPVAWALAVEGTVVRGDGSGDLDPGEALEVGARLTVPAGASATVAHNGRLARWEGPAEIFVGPVAVRIVYGGTRLRQPHVEELGNALAGDTRAPAGRGQALSALGVPLTTAAWARQDAIDGGTLHALYRDVLADRLAAAHVDRAVVEKLGLLEALPGDGGEQVALVGRYLDLADATPDAALVLEVPPTDMDRAAPRRAFGGTLLDSLRGEKPHTFRVDERLDYVRIYAKAVADALRREGRTVFGVVVPYANTVENIVGRVGKPLDGAEHLHQLLVRAGGFDAATPTVAVGYSQGAAAVREYVARYGDSDGLDYAIPLATMGGVDGAGATGVWSGKQGAVRADGVTVLAVSHARDPARGVYGRNLVQMVPGLWNFADRGRPRGEDVALHMGVFGGPFTPLPPGVDRTAALAVGMHGYPVPYLAPLYDDLFAGRHDAPWALRGAWEWDARDELPKRTAGDFVTLRRDPRALADGYRPAEAIAAPNAPAETTGAAVTPAEAPPPTPAPSR